MTEENLKRLLKHYTETDNKKALADIQKKYPGLKIEEKNKKNK